MSRYAPEVTELINSRVESLTRKHGSRIMQKGPLFPFLLLWSRGAGITSPGLKLIHSACLPTMQNESFTFWITLPIVQVTICRYPTFPPISLPPTSLLAGVQTPADRASWVVASQTLMSCYQTEGRAELWEFGAKVSQVGPQFPKWASWRAMANLCSIQLSCPLSAEENGADFFLAWRLPWHHHHQCIY